MLFYLTDSLIVEQTCDNYNNIKKAVRNLAISSCEGKHYVVGDKKAIDYFCKIFEPANDEVSMLFDYLKQNYSTQNVPNSVTVYIEVVYGDTSTRQDNGVEIIRLGYEDFLDTRSIQETVLVGEDIESDCWFYRYILQWFLNKVGINAYCRFQDRHGGGGRMAEVLKQCYCDKETSLCFVDTDKKYPNQSLTSDSTCKKCLYVRRGPRNKVRKLNVQELENLLPLNYLDMLTYEGETKKRKEHFDALRDKPNSERVFQYFDIKCGLKKYVKFKNIPDFINFAKMVCDMNPVVMEGKSFEKYYASKNDGEVLYPGLMDQVFKQTKQIIIDQNLKHPVLMGFQEQEWNSIGRLMLSFGIARRPEGITN